MISKSYSFWQNVYEMMLNIAICATVFIIWKTVLGMLKSVSELLVHT